MVTDQPPFDRHFDQHGILMPRTSPQRHRAAEKNCSCRAPPNSYTNPRIKASQMRHLPFIRDEGLELSGLDRRLGIIPGRTIKDEQCQRIGGGYEAMKFRFLLFL